MFQQAIYAQVTGGGTSASVGAYRRVGHIQTQDYPQVQVMNNRRLAPISNNSEQIAFTPTVGLLQQAQIAAQILSDTARRTWYVQQQHFPIPEPYIGSDSGQIKFTPLMGIPQQVWVDLDDQALAELGFYWFKQKLQTFPLGAPPALIPPLHPYPDFNKPTWTPASYFQQRPRAPIVQGVVVVPPPPSVVINVTPPMGGGKRDRKAEERAKKVRENLDEANDLAKQIMIAMYMGYIKQALEMMAKRNELLEEIQYFRSL